MWLLAQDLENQNSVQYERSVNPTHSSLFLIQNTDEMSADKEGDGSSTSISLRMGLVFSVYYEVRQIKSDYDENHLR
jgi:hypothetical protein